MYLHLQICIQFTLRVSRLLANYPVSVCHVIMQMNLLTIIALVVLPFNQEPQVCFLTQLSSMFVYYLPAKWLVHTVLWKCIVFEMLKLFFVVVFLLCGLIEFITNLKHQ